MTIGELARRTGCGIETIRYYEHEGLLPKPGRTSGNYRSYGQEHAELLSFIRHIGHVEERIAELQSLEGQLRELRDKCSSGRSAEHCGILRGLVDVPDDRNASGDNHVSRTHSTRR